MPQVEYDGVIHSFPDDFTDDDIAMALAQIDVEQLQPPDGTGAATALTGAARSVPGIVRGVAQFAANHPAATQKTIGAGVTGTASAIGGAIGGVPGAIAGGALRGATPTQAAIRETAGRLAGEAPEAAKTAGRAMGVVNYAREVPGLKLKPTDLISTRDATRALDSFADANGLRIPRVLDQYGKVVYGPEAAPAIVERAPGIVGRAARTTGRAVGNVLGPISAATGITDFAQTVEPERRDIGIAGIGASQPTPQGEELTALNARNIAEMEQRLKAQEQQRSDVINRILEYLGLR